MPDPEFHSSASAESLRREVSVGLAANRLDPKGLYFTERQAELWREVSLRHSPLHTRPEFQRIYEEAFASIARGSNHAQHVELIGLGSGTGGKEAQLCLSLRLAGCEVHFTAIDVSESLVRESTARLAAAGAQIRGGLVCDLAEMKFIAAWLEQHCGSRRRLITFFGLVPNFAPSDLASLLRALLRPDDILLASVHLVPARSEQESDVAEGMRILRPQYDNPETLAWLAESLTTWRLGEQLYAPRIAIDEIERAPAFIGEAKWKNRGHDVPPLRLFQSTRYTSDSFQRFLLRESLQGTPLALTACLEEGIWAINRS